MSCGAGGFYYLGVVNGRTIIGVLLVFQWLNTSAQDVRRVVHLDDIQHLHHIRHIPFNKVVVYDNRYDTTKVGILENGKMPFQVITFDRPASLWVRKYCQMVIGHHSQTNRTLYISLFQLRFVHLPDGPTIEDCLFISADDGRPYAPNQRQLVYSTVQQE